MGADLQARLAAAAQAGDPQRTVPVRRRIARRADHRRMVSDLLDGVPDGRLATIDGAVHHPMMERPGAFDATVPGVPGRRAGVTGTEANAAGLAGVFAAVGPLYRRAVRVIGDSPEVDALPVGVRAVLERRLDRGEATVPALAAELELSRQFVQRSVNDAHARSLVETRANPRHRRSALIAVTDEGERRIRSILAGELDAMAPGAAEIDPGDIDACLRVLRRLHAHLGVARGG